RHVYRAEEQHEREALLAQACIHVGDVRVVSACRTPAPCKPRTSPAKSCCARRLARGEQCSRTVRASCKSDRASSAPLYFVVCSGIFRSRRRDVVESLSV